MHENSSGHFPTPFRGKLNSERDGREGISVLVLLLLNLVLDLKCSGTQTEQLVGNTDCYLPIPPGSSSGAA